MSSGGTVDPVLDLPRVVQHVPHGPSDEEPRAPPGAPAWPFARDLSPRGRAERLDDRGAECLQLRRVGLVAAPMFPPDPSEVAVIGPDDVLDDLRQAPPTTARSFPQLLPPGSLVRRVQRRPARLVELLQPGPLLL